MLHLDLVLLNSLMPVKNVVKNFKKKMKRNKSQRLWVGILRLH